jgi:hypothetical protein
MENQANTRPLVKFQQQVFPQSLLGLAHPARSETRVLKTVLARLADVCAGLLGSGGNVIAGTQTQSARESFLLT